MTTGTTETLRIADHETRPDGTVIIDLSDGRQITAGVEWAWTPPSTLVLDGLSDDDQDAAIDAAREAGESWITATIFDGDNVDELLNEPYGGVAPHDTTRSIGGLHHITMTAGDVVETVARALGIA